MTAIGVAARARQWRSHQSSDRSAIAAYLVIVAAVAGAAQIAMLASGLPLAEQAPLVLVMMAAPAIATYLVTRVRRERLPKGTFRFGGRAARPWYWMAWLLPVLVGGVAYGFAWATGRAALDSEATPVAVIASLAVSLTIALPFSVITALGEEIGWRGFLLPRLVHAGVGHPVATTNVIWWLFHLPLVLGGLYASGRTPLVAAGFFGVAVTAIGSVAGWSRLATQSIWPAVLLHASWNSVIQGSFDKLTAGEGPQSPETLWVGESGLLVAVVAALAVLLVRRGSTSSTSGNAVASRMSGTRMP